MSRAGMLRTRRKDVNIKPNRRLDRKSSRGMIYENEELRLRTININAEIERGQSDIKKLRRENEQLRKEIWCLRDEYDKLDKLLKDKERDSSCSSCSSDTESCTSATDSPEEQQDNDADPDPTNDAHDKEASQNIENVNKTLRSEFDHLSVVTEETSAEFDTSDRNSTDVPTTNDWHALPPDQSYPTLLPPPPPPPPPLQPIKHFFAPLKSPTNGWPPPTPRLTPLRKASTDLIIKEDDSTPASPASNSFVNGGNLEQLLHDIDSISKDILHFSGEVTTPKTTRDNDATATETHPYKSELSVVLLPKPEEAQNDAQVDALAYPFPPPLLLPSPQLDPHNPFFYPYNDAYDNLGFRPDVLVGAAPPSTPTDALDDTNDEKSANINNEHAEKNILQERDAPATASVATPNTDADAGASTDDASPRPTNKGKVSIYFRGKRDKIARSLSLDKAKTKPKAKTKDKDKDSDKEEATGKSDERAANSDAKTSSDSKRNKSSSTSPERRHAHPHSHAKREHRRRHRKVVTGGPGQGTSRRHSLSLDRRSFSLGSQSHIFSHADDLTNSERERTNSISSCESARSRNHSLPLPPAGKIPWFGCWGNGCI